METEFRRNRIRISSPHCQVTELRCELRCHAQKRQIDLNARSVTQTNEKRRQGNFPAAFSFGTAARRWSPAVSGRIVTSRRPLPVGLATYFLNLKLHEEGWQLEPYEGKLHEE